MTVDRWGSFKNLTLMEWNVRFTTVPLRAGQIKNEPLWSISFTKIIWVVLKVSALKKCLKFNGCIFWSGSRQADCCCDVRSVLLKVDLLRCYRIGISRILIRERGALCRPGYPKLFVLDNAKTKQNPLKWSRTIYSV